MILYRTKYSCSDCESIFYVESDLRPKGRCPACPTCKINKECTRKGTDTHSGDIELGKKKLEARQADPEFYVGGTPENPKQSCGIIGMNMHHKAIDATAEIVMQDYKMTDINMSTTLRQGDNLVPKLEHRLEKQVDEVFKTQKPIMGQQTANNLNSTLTKQINAGVFKNYSGAGDVVARQQTAGHNIPVNIIHDYQPKDRPN